MDPQGTATPHWRHDTAIPGLQKKRKAPRADDSDGLPSEPNPAFRLLVERARLVRSRPAAVVAGMFARAGILQGLTVWPDPRWPIMCSELSPGVAAEWLQVTYPDDVQRQTLPFRLLRRLKPATQAALRTRAFLLGSRAPTLIEAAEDALGRTLADPAVALYSPSGMPISKVIHFVFAEGRKDPVAVAVAMADPSLSSRLGSEFSVIEEIRRQLRGHLRLQSCLPLEPLLVRAWEDDLLVVLPLDHLAGATGGDCREVAFGWLRDFQNATTSPERTWSALDDEREVELVARSWRRLNPKCAEPVAHRTRELLGAITRHPPPCVVHGDFWRGNIAASADGELRVFDWEWAELIGHPALDPLMFEVGDIRAATPRLGPGDVVDELRGALDRIGSEFEQRGYELAVPEAFLAPTIARFIDRSHALVRDASDPLARLMAGAETILGSERP